MKKTFILGLLMFILSGATVWAAARTPHEVVQDTSARMIDALRQNRAVLDAIRDGFMNWSIRSCCPILISS